MGAWGTGPFENDDALDFASEIKSVFDLGTALKSVTDDAQMEADLASRVIVAAECVAAMHGHRHKDMPTELAAIVHGFGKPADSLYETAREQLSHVLVLSELAQL